MTKSRMQEFIDDAQQCGRLTNWEQDFVADLATRYAVYGDKLIISCRQQDVIDRIESKVYA